MRLHLHPTCHEALTVDSTGRVLTRWSLTTNPATRLIQRSTPLSSNILYSPSGSMINEGGITGAPDGRFFAHAHCSHNESFHADILELRHWQDLSSSRTIAIPYDIGNISGLAGSPDGRWLVVGSGAELLFLIDRQTGEVMSYHTIAGYTTTGLTFDPTSTFVAGIATFDGGGSPMLCRLDPVERFVPRLRRNEFRPDTSIEDHVSGNMALTALHRYLDRSGFWPERNYGETLGTAAFSPDSSLVIFNLSFDDVNTCVVAYEVPSGKRLWGIFREGINPENFIFTPDGSALIFPTESGDLFVYRVEDGAFVQQLSSGFDQPIQVLAFDHDGTTLWLMIEDELVQCPHLSK